MYRVERVVSSNRCLSYETGCWYELDAALRSFPESLVDRSPAYCCLVCYDLVKFARSADAGGEDGTRKTRLGGTWK